MVFAVGKKSGPNATFNLSFLRLGWPRVGEFGGFIAIFLRFPTKQDLVNRKHRIVFLIGGIPNVEYQRNKMVGFLDGWVYGV